MQSNPTLNLESESLEPTIFEQRRLSHLSSILVRNLTLNPIRDRALRSLALTSSTFLSSSTSQESQAALSFPPGANAADDTDLALAERQRQRERERDGGRNSILRRNSRDNNTISRRTNSLNGDELWNGNSSIKSGRVGNGRKERGGNMVRTLSGNAGSGDGEGTSLRPAIRRAASSAIQSEKNEDTSVELGGSLGIGTFNPTSSIMPSRPRTTSTTSWASGISGKSSLSVRFDASSSSNSTTHVGGRGGAYGTSAWTAKALKDVMGERLCESYVSLSLPSSSDLDKEGDLKSEPKSESKERTFFKTKPSSPSIHAAWGLTPPIDPERDFINLEEGSEVGFQSRVVVRLFGRSEGKGKGKGKENGNGKGKGKQIDRSEWQMLFEREVGLNELERIGNNLADSQIPLPSNSVLIGLTTTLPQFSDNDLNLNSVLQDPPSSSALKRAQTASHVSYYLVRPPSISSDETSNSSAITGSKLKSNANDFLSDSEREDYTSDPEFTIKGLGGGTGNGTERRTSNSVLDRRKRIANARNEHRAVMERSLRETRMMKSYDVEELKSLIEVQNSLRSQAKEDSDLRKSLDEELRRPDCPFVLKLHHGEQSDRLKRLNTEVKSELSDVEKRKESLSSRREALAKRKERLKAARSLLQKDEQDMDHQREVIQELQTQQSDLSFSLYSRRVSLLRSLEVIFPIELIDASTLLFTINGIALPNALSDDHNPKHPSNSSTRSLEKEALSNSNSKFNKIDEETISSALGLVAQLVVLLSTYLSTPIHYPIATAGSRAVILDGISVMNGNRTFPLFSKGVESYRFEYAVFLLNKNVEQLMNCYQIGMLDLKHTLPNLKNLILTLTAKESNPNSHRSRKKLVGKKEISLRSGVDQIGLGKGLPTEINGSSVDKINGAVNGNGSAISNSISESKTVGSGWGSSLFSGWRTGSTISKINEDKREENQNEVVPTVRRLG